jgi:uncharacterized protein YneF (UPF0154 family)
MINIASIWGALSGLLYILLTWISLDKREELAVYPAWGLITMVLYICILGFCIFFAMRTTRNKLYYESGINYAQTFYIGVVTSLVTGVLFGIFSFVYIQYMNPGLAEELVKEMTIEMGKVNKTPKEIAETVQHVRESYEPKNQLMSSLIGTSIMGMICSALLAVFVRNRDTFSTK